MMQHTLNWYGLAYNLLTFNYYMLYFIPKLQLDWKLGYEFYRFQRFGIGSQRCRLLSSR